MRLNLRRLLVQWSQSAPESFRKVTARRKEAGYRMRFCCVTYRKRVLEGGLPSSLNELFQMFFQIPKSPRKSRVEALAA